MGAGQILALWLLPKLWESHLPLVVLQILLKGPKGIETGLWGTWRAIDATKDTEHPWLGAEPLRAREGSSWQRTDPLSRVLSLPPRSPSSSARRPATWAMRRAGSSPKS